MSKIFAYAGNENCKKIILDGLLKLDENENELSSIAIQSNESFSYMSIEGTPAELSVNAIDAEGDGSLGIAISKNKSRNGDSALSAGSSFCAAALDEIENFDDLCRAYGIINKAKSGNDLVLFLLNLFNDENRLKTVKRISEILNGTGFAFAPSNENAIYCKAGSLPLWIGISTDSFIISSEAAALSKAALKCICLSQNETVKITADKALFFDEKLKRIKKQTLSVPPVSEAILSNGSYDEDIYCPISVKETVKHFTNEDKLNIESLKLSKRGIEKIKKIIITGEGENFNAAAAGAYSIQLMSDISTIAIPSGELEHSGEVIDKATLVIAVSICGSCKSTVACAKRAKAFGARVIGITCKNCSALSAECSEIINPNPEIVCANNSLISFITAYISLCFFGLYLGVKNSIVSELYLGVTIRLSKMLSGKTAQALKTTAPLNVTAEKILHSQRLFVTGLGSDGRLSLEGAKIIRDFSDANASGVLLSELCCFNKNIIDGAVIIAFITNKELCKKSLLMLNRLSVLGANITIFADANTAEEITGFENVITFADSIPLFNPVCAISSLFKAAKTANQLLNDENEKQAI